MSRPRKGELTDGQRAFVAAYTNPAEPTYLKGAPSYRKAYPNAKHNAVGASVSHYLKHPTIRSEIERVLDAAGATPEVSAHTLSTIIQGTAESESTQYDKDGNIIARTVTRPRAADRLKAVDLRYKLTGHYVRQQAQAEIAKEEYSRLLKDTGLSTYIDTELNNTELDTEAEPGA